MNMNTETLLSSYPDLLTPKDLQEIMPIGKSKIYSLLQSGEIKSKKVGNKLVIPKTFLLEYILSA